MSVLELARPAIQRLQPYSSARSLGSDGEVFVDANECPWSPLAADPYPRGIHRYPEPQPPALLDRLARLFGVGSAQLFLGRGTDEAIDTLTRTFCEAEKEAVLICPPTYGMYEVAANIQGARVVRVPTTAPEFDVSADAILAAWDPSVKLVYLCSPNNPTGNLVPETVVVELAERLAGRAILVLDEAYIDFAPEASRIALRARFPGLVILRTLSKAFGLAGARCGVAIGDPVLIGLLQKVRAPYPMSAPTTACVLEALSDEGQSQARHRILKLIAERVLLSGELRTIPGVRTVYPSDANFILVRFEDQGAGWVSGCRKRGVVLRDRGREKGLENCVRISVGTEIENARVVATLREVSRELA